jgi:hypothetical protein
MRARKFDARCRLAIAAAVGIAGAVAQLSAAAAPAADDVEAQAREAWREAIVRTAVPEEACFHAAYPSTVWIKVECTAAPNRLFLPRGGATSFTVGNGHDYAAEVSGLMTASVGTFPTVTGVKSEKGAGVKNDYSIQLNSNFMVTAACNGHSSCLSWEQFVYSSGEEAAFMQYWLIDYGTSCPAGGWNYYEGSCYKNSAAVTVPTEKITLLEYLKLSGTAVAGGKDTLVFTAETDAYSTTGKDSVVDLATDWSESEFNVIGDGGGSKAVFNKVSSITVKIAVTDGSTSAPTCAADAGTTGETNNLTLGSCTASGGSAPAIEFVESN